MNKEELCKWLRALDTATSDEAATLIEQQAEEVDELKGMNQRQSAGIARLEEENAELRR